MLSVGSTIFFSFGRKNVLVVFYNNLFIKKKPVSVIYLKDCKTSSVSWKNTLILNYSYKSNCFIIKIAYFYKMFYFIRYITFFFVIKG